MYRIVKRTRKGLQIGLNSYTLEQVNEVAERMRRVGHRVEIMAESEVFC